MNVEAVREVSATCPWASGRAGAGGADEGLLLTGSIGGCKAGTEARGRLKQQERNYLRSKALNRARGPPFLPIMAD